MPQRPDEGLSEDDCRRIAAAVARLLASAWDRERAREREAG